MRYEKLMQAMLRVTATYTRSPCCCCPTEGTGCYGCWAGEYYAMVVRRKTLKILQEMLEDAKEREGLV